MILEFSNVKIKKELDKMLENTKAWIVQSS